MIWSYKLSPNPCEYTGSYPSEEPLFEGGGGEEEDEEEEEEETFCDVS